MPVQFNHTIVTVKDKNEAADFFASILGLPTAGRFGPFRVLELANGASLDFADDHGPVARRVLGRPERARARDHHGPLRRRVTSCAGRRARRSARSSR